MKRVFAKLTYANVVSSLCLVLVLGGGTAYAASKLLPKNSVGTAQIRNGAVTPAKLSKAAKPVSPLLKSLPAGKTEFGTIGAESQVDTNDTEISANAQLPIPAPVALVGAHVLIGPSATCKGTAVAPSAPRGDVCIYPYFESFGVNNLSGYVWGGAASKYGFQMSFDTPFSGSTQGDAVFGNWAYTAP